jgi:hypothetical protein
VAVVLAAIVVFALGRASMGGGSPSGAPSPRSAIPGVGPTRTVHGVPAGYAHTRAGALAAALNYIGVIGNPAVLFDEARLRRALAVVATPQLARTSMASYRRAAGTLAQSRLVQSVRSGAPTIAMGVPVAYRVAGVALSNRVKQAGTCLLATPAGFGADPAVLVMLGVALALLGACRT